MNVAGGCGYSRLNSPETKKQVSRIVDSNSTIDLKPTIRKQKIGKQTTFTYEAPFLCKLGFPIFSAEFTAKEKLKIQIETFMKLVVNNDDAGLLNLDDVLNISSDNLLIMLNATIKPASVCWSEGQFKICTYLKNSTADFMPNS